MLEFRDRDGRRNVTDGDEIEGVEGNGGALSPRAGDNIPPFSPPPSPHGISQGPGDFFVTSQVVDNPFLSSLVPQHAALPIDRVN